MRSKLAGAMIVLVIVLLYLFYSGQICDKLRLDPDASIVVICCLGLASITLGGI